VIAALSSWHEHHDAAASAVADVSALPAHVVIECYSVLTRLPGGLAVAPELAAEVLGRRFPHPPLRLHDAARGTVLADLARVGVCGGASYDGVVALEAAAHGRRLLSLDRRAHRTYARLGVAFDVIG
jgi:hypothetical protein